MAEGSAASNFDTYIAEIHNNLDRLHEIPNVDEQMCNTCCRSWHRRIPNNHHLCKLVNEVDSDIKKFHFV